MRSPIRVLRIIPVLDFGGVESVFLTQARYWKVPDIQVEYLTFWKDGHIATELRKIGAHVHVLDVDPSIRNLRATVALKAFLQRYKPDVVHSAIGEANFHAMLCAKLGPWKTIIEEAGLPQRNFRNRLIHRALYALPDKILCVSQAGADNLRTREWAPQRKVVVVHNPIAAEYFLPPESRNPDLKRFRAVGRLTAVKNFDGLIRAFALARRDAPDIRLDIIGEGEERENLTQLIQSLDQENAITLCGFHEDIASLLADTGWLLMPSHREGFGLVAAEAMAAGVPVLASGAGGLREVLGPLADNWTIPAENTAQWSARITNLANVDAAAYKKASAQFKAQADRFRPERYVDDLARLYNGL